MSDVVAPFKATDVVIAVDSHNGLLDGGRGRLPARSVGRNPGAGQPRRQLRGRPVRLRLPTDFDYDAVRDRAAQCRPPGKILRAHIRLEPSFSLYRRSLALKLLPCDGDKRRAILPLPPQRRVRCPSSSGSPGSPDPRRVPAVSPAMTGVLVVVALTGVFEMISGRKAVVAPQRTEIADERAFDHGH